MIERSTGAFPLCYVCGSDNPKGLHATFERDGDRGCRATYVVEAEHVGWPNLMHGGLLFTLMDEAVAWALIFAGHRGVTAKAEVRFRRPANVGDTLVIKATAADAQRRFVRTFAEIHRMDRPDEIIADLDATMALVEPA